MDKTNNKRLLKVTRCVGECRGKPMLYKGEQNNE